jgi:hypothetical protein
VLIQNLRCIVLALLELLLLAGALLRALVDPTSNAFLFIRFMLLFGGGIRVFFLLLLELLV